MSCAASPAAAAAPQNRLAPGLDAQGNQLTALRTLMTPGHNTAPMRGMFSSPCGAWTSPIAVRSGLVHWCPLRQMTRRGVLGALA